jgi:glycerophosphoryl diester phosphodiesterase
VITLARREGRPLRIGHRGAATLAPENTLASFRAALDVGVDLIEFDVVAARNGDLVVAHAAADVQSETPTLGEALRFFVDEAPHVDPHLDLKVRGRERDLVAALRRFELEERSFISGFRFGTARAVREHGADIRVGITFPRGVFGIGDQGRRAPVARAGLRGLRGVTPSVVPWLLGSTGATAIALHHRLVTAASVAAAHSRGAPVVTWTVDDREDLARVDAAGVDAVVTNDPRIFTSTLIA